MAISALNDVNRRVVLIKYTYFNSLLMSDTNKAVVLGVSIDLPHTDKIRELVVNLIPKSYNEDNKKPFFILINGDLKNLLEITRF